MHETLTVSKLPSEVNILTLSYQDAESIRQIISERNGGVHIFIHPFAGLHRITMTDETELPNLFDQDRLIYAIAPSTQDFDDHHRYWRAQDKPRICLTISDIVHHALGNENLSEDQRRQLLQTENNKQPKAGPFRTARYDRNGQVILTDEYSLYLRKLTTILRKEHLIVLAEAKACLTETIQALREIGYQGRILYYPTHSDGTPSPSEDLDGLNQVAEILANLKANKLLIGGQYSDLMYVPSSQTKEKRTPLVFRFSQDIYRVWIGEGCVGEFGERMSRSNLFENVTLSAASFPKSSPRLSRPLRNRRLSSPP